MRDLSFLGGALAAVVVSASCAPTPPVRYADLSAPSTSASTPPPPAATPTDPAARADALVAKMTLEEKVAYIGGDRDFYIRPIERLGIPEIKLADGPVGCRNWGESTNYPASIGLAAAFDDGLTQQVGASIARDCRVRGVHILLAPGVNIQRSPLNGRNFEYLGEDPLVAKRGAVAFIRGVQGEGVLATVKHFVANNQEWDRNHISSEVSERALREIYYPAFEAAVKEAKVGAVMTAYNLLNGTYCSHHEKLLRDVLRGEWGFQGIIMSDWMAVHDTMGAVKGGMDLEMPRAMFMNLKQLKPLMKAGKVTEAEIDEKVRHILRTVIAAGFFDRKQQSSAPKDDPTSRKVALAAARQAPVLLKNTGALLPLDATKLKKIAVIGPNAHPAVHAGSGSAFTTPFSAVSILDGIKKEAPDVEVVHHPGIQQKTVYGMMGQAVFEGPVKEEIFPNQKLEGAPKVTREVDRIDMRADGKSPAPGIGKEHYSIRWTGTLNVDRAGKYLVLTNADDGVRVFVDGKKVLDDWSDHAPRTRQVAVPLTAGKHTVKVEYFQGILGSICQFGFGPDFKPNAFFGAAKLRSTLRGADAVVVAVGYGQSGATNSFGAAYAPFWPPGWARDAGIVEAEDDDRSFPLPKAQLETLKIASAMNRKVIVIGHAGGGVDFNPWLKKVPALLWAWYPGQEGGTALAEILFGTTNPSGKLPVTFAKAYDDHPAAPYYQQKNDKKTPYTEGVFVGYRGFDAANKAPLFPFGHGLSYTTFEYSDLTLTKRPAHHVHVKVTVKNTGKVPGAEVVQFYVTPPEGSAVKRPPQELVGYGRVELTPGEAKEVEVMIEPRAFAYWHDGGWVVDTGTYGIAAAASSRGDERLSGEVKLPGTRL